MQYISGYADRRIFLFVYTERLKFTSTQFRKYHTSFSKVTVCTKQLDVHYYDCCIIIPVLNEVTKILLILNSQGRRFILSRFLLFHYFSYLPTYIQSYRYSYIFNIVF